MLNTKLFKLLRHLSSEEMKAVKVYLSSKHKRTAKAFRLFDYIDKNRHNLEGNKDKFTKEKIYKHVYGKEAYNRGKMQELASRLLKEIGFYLIMNEVEDDELLRDVLLSKVFKKRGMDDIFKLHNDKAQKNIHNIESLEHKHLDALVRLNHDATFHRDIPKLNTAYDELLAQASTYRDTQYVLDKLKIICEQITRKDIIKSADNKALLPIDIQNIIQKIPNNVLIDIYLRVIRMYEQDSLEIYQQLKKEILENKLSLSPEYRYDILVILINFCNKIYKQNAQKNYRKELYELFKFIVENDLLIIDGYISENHYISALKVLTALKDWTNVKRFIKLSEKLKPEYREAGLALALATLHFAEKKYGDTKTELQKIKMKDANYQLTGRSLLLRSYYELNETKPLKTLIAACKKFIGRQKILAPATVEANRNFYNFIAELVRHKDKSTPDSTEVLAQQLQNYSTIVHREWCLNKIEELN